jgi:hypothetical protein
MFKITDTELDNIVHDLTRIASHLQAVENGNLTEGQRTILHGLVMRLGEIRQHLLESVEENGNAMDKGS